MTQARTGFAMLTALILAATSAAAPRQHTVLLGQARNASVTTETGRTIPFKMRKLLIDERFKEYTAGPSHEVSDRLFVIRRIVQLNDSLPQETGKPPRWIWRMEGWISVDRVTGRVSPINLPMFDHETSEVSWYRDLAAYCGTSDDHGRAYLMVFQLGRRKPLLKKEFTGEPCSAPTWERQPMRVSFGSGDARTSFVITAGGAGLQTDNSDKDEDESE